MPEIAKTDKQARARLMWERDKLPLSEIAKAIGVSDRTISNWAEQGLPNKLRGPWVKGGMAEKVVEAYEEGALTAARKAGLSMERFFIGVRELVDAECVLVPGPQGGKLKVPLPPTAEVAAENVSRETITGNGSYPIFPNLDARKDGLKLMADTYPGLKAAAKMQVDFPSRMLAFFQGDD